MVPASYHGGGDAKIVGNCLDCVSLVDRIAGSSARECRAIFRRCMLARCNGDDELAFRLKIFLTLEMIYLGD